MKKSKYTEIITEASTSEKAPAGAAAEPAPGCASCAPRVTTAEEARANAAEASAAASEELSGQASMLKELVARFRLKDQYEL